MLDHESKYLEFRFVEKKAKTRVYEVASKVSGCRLGLIKWYGSWRQYSFFPEQGTLFNSQCLSEISDYLIYENRLHKEIRGKSLRKAMEETDD